MFTSNLKFKNQILNRESILSRTQKSCHQMNSIKKGSEQSASNNCTIKELIMPTQ